ncbi:hypothetical protein KQX54_021885 [Cotesia glomerata]|uniref:Uncharacterized protein n=1 Tax=Cotesia glomerata TaxID=32391 RepID=A0AAV7JA50_COTGL|nr:hypothetical protein KQX54_021885 [Cotesia glomerata]
MYPYSVKGGAGVASGGAERRETLGQLRRGAMLTIANGQALGSPVDKLPPSGELGHSFHDTRGDRWEGGLSDRYREICPRSWTQSGHDQAPRLTVCPVYIFSSVFRDPACLPAAP